MQEHQATPQLRSTRDRRRGARSRAAVRAQDQRRDEAVEGERSRPSSGPCARSRTSRATCSTTSSRTPPARATATSRLAERRRPPGGKALRDGPRPERLRCARAQAVRYLPRSSRSTARDRSALPPRARASPWASAAAQGIEVLPQPAAELGELAPLEPSSTPGSASCASFQICALDHVAELVVGK